MQKAGNWNSSLTSTTTSVYRSTARQNICKTAAMTVVTCDTTTCDACCVHARVRADTDTVHTHRHAQTRTPTTKRTKQQKGKQASKQTTQPLETTTPFGHTQTQALVHLWRVLDLWLQEPPLHGRKLLRVAHQCVSHHRNHVYRAEKRGLKDVVKELRGRFAHKHTQTQTHQRNQAQHGERLAPN